MGTQWKLWIGSIVLLLAGTGCMENETLVLVKKDGSGTITETSYLSAQAAAMMKNMKAQNGEADADAGLVDKTKMTEKGEAMGAKLVSAEDVKAPDGRDGYKAVWSFEDISKIKLFVGDAPQEAAEGEEDDKTFKFSFTKGATPTLAIDAPPMDLENGLMGGDAPPDPAQAKQQIMMMKNMMGGLKMALRIAVDGTITETNASYPDKENNRITLMSMDFDKMTEDVDKFVAMSQIKEKEKAQQAIKDMPGLDAETKESIKISFK